MNLNTNIKPLFPSTVTLGVGALTQEFGRDMIHSIVVSKSPFHLVGLISLSPAHP